MEDEIKMQLTFEDADICERRHGGSMESRKARESLSPGAIEAQRREILDYLVMFPKGGLTCWELHIALDLMYTSASARCSELKKMGAIEKIGTRPTPTGRKAAILQIKGLNHGSAD